MSEETVPSERVEYWKARWNEGQIGFHQPDVHKMLLKYVAKLLPEGKANKVFFPLCGKTLDMKWIYDEGFTVVGVEGVKSAIVQFFAEQNIEYSEEDVELKGEIFKLLKSKDGRIRLYWTDILKFSLDFEGTIDAVWDRGSLVALDRKDVPEYVQVIKSILSTKGHILLEVMEYDVSIMNEIQGPDKPPPPHPMYETELKKLYEPECKVEFLERGERKVYGKDVHTAIYNIYK
ncbi:unnamed protein product [Lymnaea stagnalis]|uniref:thiopurine S-methyltransferase n=1 Tax=Lymnaea stagnalis TaxID=6523 RepID=A0AAV2HUY2_LYMST